MSATLTFNPNAPSFEAPTSTSRPQRPQPGASNQRNVRPQNNRPQNQRPQNQRPQNNKKDQESNKNRDSRPTKPQTQQPSALPVKQQSDVLPFLVSTGLINVGNNGVKTMEAARPTLKPFSMEQQFKELAKDTDIKRTLRHRWTIWLQGAKSQSPVPGTDSSANVVDYMSELQEKVTFSSVPEFCQHWNKAYLEGNPPYSKIVVFKKGIKPVWEDPDNKKGGRYVIRGSTMEETLAMYLVIVTRMMTGRLHGDYNDLVGAVLQAKGSDQLWIQIWNKDSSDNEQISRFKISLNRLVNRTVAYQVHDQSLKMQKTRTNKDEEVSVANKTEAPVVAQAAVDDYVKNFLEA